MRNRRGTKRFPIVTLAFTALLIVWCVLTSKLVYLSFQEAKDLYSDDFDIKKEETGGHIETEIYAIFGTCAEETITTTQNGSSSTKSSHLYYIVPAYSGEETYFICLEVKSGDQVTYNRIMSNTLKFLNGTASDFGSTTADFKGTISDLDDDVYKYMKEWFKEDGFSDEEIAKYVLPYCLTPMNFGVRNVYIIIAAVLLALTVLLWVLFFVKLKKAKGSAAYAQNLYQSENGGNYQYDGQMYGGSTDSTGSSGDSGSSGNSGT